MLTQIKASAGSGKTYTLTRHFLSLLAGAQGGGPDACAALPALPSEPGTESFAPYDMGGILAATFTNKAATEMKARVMRDLKAAALGREKDVPFDPESARAWVERILRHFDALNIRTIDSLLAMLVRAGALSLHLPPDFAPVFDDEEYFGPLYDALLDKLAADEPITRGAVREACRGLIFHGEAKGFLAGDTVRDRLLDVVRFSLSLDEDAPRIALGEEKAEALRQAVAALRERVMRTAEHVLALVEEERLEADSNFLNWVRNCVECGVKPPAAPPVWPGKSCLDECLKAVSRGRGSSEAARAFLDLTSAFDAFSRFTPPLRNALELAPFAELAEPLAEDMARRQREEGRVPAARMPFLARRILEGRDAVTDAFCRLGNRLTHLLFDEFQDTSRQQWASMHPLAEECLAKGGSLTYVGDVKQAIYGWRGGDAALFDEVPDDPSLRAMLREKPEARSLGGNWRSAPAVIHCNNRVFCALDSAAKARELLEAMMPKDTPDAILTRGAKTLAKTFAGAKQAVPEQRAAALKDTPGFVRFTRVETANKEELLDAVRARLIPLVRDELLPRRAYGDIAILVRRNEEASLVASWLTDEGVPVVTEHSFLLASHPLVLRLASFLAFLEYPADDTAFWDFIAGPELFRDVSGLDEGTLFAWLAAVRGGGKGPGKDGVPASAPLYRLFARDYPEIWQRWIAPFHDLAGLMSPYDTLREIIRRFGVLERMPAHAPFVRRFLEVADAAERQGYSSVSSFLEYWTESGHKEKVPMPEGMDAVRVLTMHKAKGLEFPVVIVPFHHGGGAGHAPLTLAAVGEFTVLTRLTKHLGEPYYQRALRDALEQINLLYVAWTRPTEELHAFLGASKFYRTQPGLAKALPVLLDVFDFDGETCVTPESREPETPDAPPLAAEGGAAVPGARESGAIPPPFVRGTPGDAPFVPMDWLPRLKIFRNPLGDLAFTERKRGLLAHACMEQLRFTGNIEADAALACEQALRGFPLPVPEEPGGEPAQKTGQKDGHGTETVRREMLNMLVWFLSLPDGPRWLEQGRAEQSLLDEDGKVYRVDLLVDEGEAGLLTVEYKTGKPSPAHEEQVRRYIRLLSGATGRKARGVLVYLDLRELRRVEGTATGGAA